MPEVEKKHVRTEFGKGKGPTVHTKDGKEQHPAPQNDQASQAPAQYVGVDFPSKYLVYPGLDLTKVGIRLLKGKDEKLIAELSYDNFERKFVEIIRNVMVGIDPREMTIGDRLYVMLWEAINSYSKIVDIETQCGSCLQKVTYQIDLSQLAVIELPADFKEPYPIQLSNGNVVNMRLFRVKDEERLFDVQKAGHKTWLYRFALSIVDDKNEWDKVAYLEELNTRDLALIRAFHEKYYHGPKMEAITECPKCGVSEVTPVPFRLEFFFPYGKALRKYFGGTV